MNTEMIKKAVDRKTINTHDLETAIYNDVFGDPALDDGDERKENFVMIGHACIGGYSDTLCGLYKNGPLYDGDVPSKGERDWLLDKGYCAKVVVKGQDGYNACTYSGAWLYRCQESYFKLKKG